MLRARGVHGQGTREEAGGQAVKNEKTGREGLPRLMKLIWDSAEALECFFLPGKLPIHP